VNITIVYEGVIPAKTYGGIQRSVWYLGKQLTNKGHQVTFLVGAGSTCYFAPVVEIDREKPIASQMPAGTEVAHICMPRGIELGSVGIPYIINVRVNIYEFIDLDVNSVFISKNHAARYGSDVYVHNGMDWDDYGPVDLNNDRTYFHFLGKASWRIKNLQGAIKVVRKTPHEKLAVLGGTRLNFNQGFRFTLSRRIKFYGMVGGDRKHALLQGSKGLILPVRWDEPFGNAMTESLYFGCPVFGTPYGSQQEIVIPEVGFLSNKSDELAEAVMQVDTYSRRRCHEYARDNFNASLTADRYLRLYEKVLNGEHLHDAPPKLKAGYDVQKRPWN
jgi:glycosyltransferase involved in cell wall biosynthesis